MGRCSARLGLFPRKQNVIYQIRLKYGPGSCSWLGVLLGMDTTEQQIHFLHMALGDDAFDLMVRSLRADPRVQGAHTVDIVIRKDGVEKRVEGDWIKYIARIVRNVALVPR